MQSLLLYVEAELVKIFQFREREHKMGEDIRMTHLIAVTALDGSRVARLVTLFRNVVFTAAILAHCQ